MSTVGVFLCEILSNGPRSAQEVRQVVEAAGFSWWTARRVPDIEKARAGFGPGSAVVWKLANGTFVHTEHEECDRGSPPHTEQPVSRVATPETAIPEATRTPSVSRRSTNATWLPKCRSSRRTSPRVIRYPVASTPEDVHALTR
jgi:hypothetical protein